MARPAVTAAAIYARISSDDGSALGVSRQLEDCRRLATELGWTVAEEYVDNDVSAYSGKRRPGYEAMLDDIAAGERDGVIAYHQDRLTRRPIESERFVEVMQAAGVNRVRFAAGGEVDLANGDGLLMLRIQAAVAANESDAKSRRVRRKLDQVAEEGRPHGGGQRPFGYESDRVTVRADEAVIYRQLVERFLAGESLISLTRWLNDEGVATTGRASAWKTPTLRGMLYGARYSGQREHRGEIVGPAVWPAIITPEQTARIRAILDDPTRKKSRTPRTYVLSGLLRCSKCGTVLTSHPQRDRRTYVCRSGPDFGGCGAIRISADRVEELITEAVLYRLDTPELAAALSGAQAADETTAALAEQITADEQQLEELAGLYAQRAISAAEWMAARNPIESRLRTNKRQIARATSTSDLARYIGQGSELRTQWSALNLGRQRAVIATVLDHAIVEPRPNPGGRVTTFDPSRVVPVWRL